MCALGLGLSVYLVVFALYSISISSSNFRNESSIKAAFVGPISTRPGLPKRHPSNRGLRIVHPRNLQMMNPRRFRARQMGPKIDWCHALGFYAHPGPRVALASFPGSGNTWLRYLLQQSTGILTGSIYKDYALLKNGFPAESITNGSVIVVKTHEYGNDAISMFDRAILLIRDPFASILAEFNRRSGGHIGHASVEKYRHNGGKYWRSFVKSKAAEWRKMNLAWFEGYNDRPGGLVTIAYEDLVRDPEKQLSKVLNFLGVKVPEASMRCAILHKEGIYKRGKQKAVNFPVFDPELMRAITAEEDVVYRKLGLSRPPEPPSIVSSRQPVNDRGIININSTEAIASATSTHGKGKSS